MCVCKTDQKHVSEEELWVQEIIAVEVGFIASCGIKQWSDLYTVILSVGESPPGKHCYGFVFIQSQFLYSCQKITVDLRNPYGNCLKLQYVYFQGDFWRDVGWKLVQLWAIVPLI